MFRGHEKQQNRRQSLTHDNSISLRLMFKAVQIKGGQPFLSFFHPLMSVYALQKKSSKREPNSQGQGISKVLLLRAKPSWIDYMPGILMKEV